MMIVTLAAIVAAPILLYLLIAKWRHQFWLRKGVPQFEPHLIFGNIKPMTTEGKSLKDFYLELYQRAKRAGLKHVGIYSFITPVFVACDIDLIKRILSRDFSYFGSHGFFHHKNDPNSMNVITMDGQEWKDRRVKLTPIFTTGKMKMMFDVVAEKAAGLSQVIDEHIVANESVDIKDILARFTTDVIGSVAFGLDVDTLQEPHHEFREIGRKSRQPKRLKILLEMTIPHNLLGILGYKRQSKEVTSYFTKVVTDNIKHRESNNVQRKDFLQLMIQLKNHGAIGNDDDIFGNTKGKHFVTEDEVVSEAFLFYTAGFETSASTMTFAFLELAQNVDIQDKLRYEIKQVLAKHGGKITYDNLGEMEYLDKVVKETLRKYPVVPVLPRECTKSYKLNDSDVVIDKGTKIMIPIIGVHLDPEYYPNPEQFAPENFSPENRAKRPEFAWIPFGEGPRQCIGLRFGLMQSKIGIAILLTDYKFTLDKTMKPPYESLAGSFTYMLKNNVMLRVSRI